MDELRSIIEKASSPSDIATVLLAGTVGFVVDAGFNPVGFLNPGQTGLALIGLSMGVKKSLEAALYRLTVLKRAQGALSYIVKHQNEYQDGPWLRRSLERDIDLYSRKVITAAQLAAAMGDVLTSMRLADPAVMNAEPPPEQLEPGQPDD